MIYKVRMWKSFRVDWSTYKGFVSLGIRLNIQRNCVSVELTLPFINLSFGIFNRKEFNEMTERLKQSIRDIDSNAWTQPIPQTPKGL